MRYGSGDNLEYTGFRVKQCNAGNVPIISSGAPECSTNYPESGYTITLFLCCQLENDLEYGYIITLFLCYQLENPV